jgi:hypothetical protein
MKKSIMFLSMLTTVALLALPVFANGVYSRANDAQDPCSVDAKIALYTDFVKFIRTDQAKAYEIGKKYVACPSNNPDATDEEKAAEAKRVAYINDFIGKYEKANEKLNRKAQLKDLVYNKKDYAKAFEIGKQVLADEPDYFEGNLALGYAGFAAYGGGNKSFASDAVTYAKKAMEMIESGKATVEKKDDALAKLNYWIATLKQESAPSEAVPYWIKAASYDTFKKDPDVYFNLGVAYEKGPYQKQSDGYNQLYKDKPETPESKLALENINQVVDRMIDAYARAVALSGNNTQSADLKSKALEATTAWYKFRHNNTDTGLNDLIAGVLSKPLPPEPAPITSLPTPPSTPAGTGATPGTSTTGAAAQTPPKTTTTTTTKNTPTKPPKRRRAHAGH